MHRGEGDNLGRVAALGVEGAALIERCARVRVRVAPEEEWPPSLSVVVHDRRAVAVWRGCVDRAARVQSGQRVAWPVFSVDATAVGGGPQPRRAARRRPRRETVGQVLVEVPRAGMVAARVDDLQGGVAAKVLDHELSGRRVDSSRDGVGA